MASGTIYGTTGNEYIDSKIEWSSVADNDANTSTVTATLWLKRNNTGYTTRGTGNFSIVLAYTKYSASKYITITNSDWVLAMTATKTVSHNLDGTKIINITASGEIPGTTLTSISCAGRATLDTIPRASTITNAGEFSIGTNIYVTWTPASKDFRYKLRFEVGDWSLTTSAIHPNTTSSYISNPGVLPWDVATYYPDDTQGVVSVTLFTYSDSGATAQVGEAYTQPYPFRIPDNAESKPYATSMTLSPVDSLGEDFAGLYIQGISKVRVESTVKGKYGARVVSQTIKLGGVNYGSDGDYTSGYLSESGTIYVTLVLTDSRGFSNSKTLPITVIPYQKPRVIPVTNESSVACGRCDSSGNWSDSGTYLKIKAGKSYSPCIADGVQKNFCGLRYRYKKVSDSDYGAWNTLIPITNTQTDEIVTSPLLNGTLSVTESYMVQVDAVDSIPNHTPMTFTIQTEKVYMHKAGSLRSLGIGEYVQDSNVISIADDIAVKVKNSINGVFMGTKVVSGTNAFDIQTKYADFTGTGNGNERQTLFMFGAANASLVYGLARVSNSGVTQWSGTDGVTLSTKSGGILTVTLPTTAYDIFTVFSSRKFKL